MLGVENCLKILKKNKNLINTLKIIIKNKSFIYMLHNDFACFLILYSTNTLSFSSLYTTYTDTELSVQFPQVPIEAKRKE